jgi:hypothetical protein
MRPPRSAIFRSSVLTSRRTSEANRRRRRAEAPPWGRKRSRHPAGDEIPQERVKAV